MSEPIHFTVRTLPAEDPQLARVALEGELDFASVPTARRELRRIERRRPPVLVLELAGLRFMDVSGLRMILDAARRAARDGRRLVVADPIAPIMRLFELTAIDQSVELVTSPFQPASA